MVLIVPIVDTLYYRLSVAKGTAPFPVSFWRSVFKALDTTWFAYRDPFKQCNPFPRLYFLLTLIR